jgi:hypothetical protein
MKHRERVEMALNHEVPDRIPYQAMFTPEFADRLRKELNITILFLLKTKLCAPHYFEVLDLRDYIKNYLKLSIYYLVYVRWRNNLVRELKSLTTLDRIT